MRRRRLLTADENRLFRSGSDDGSRTLQALLLILLRIGAAVDELRVVETGRSLRPKLMDHVKDDALEHVPNHLEGEGRRKRPGEERKGAVGGELGKGRGRSKEMS